jgi:transcriptional regulator with XRE-family HTH domain
MPSRKPNEIDQIIGANIKRQRTARGMTQVALAGAVGITFQQLQKYENAVNRISASRLFHLAKAVGMPIGEFFAQGRGPKSASSRA